MSRVYTVFHTVGCLDPDTGHLTFFDVDEEGVRASTRKLRSHVTWELLTAPSTTGVRNARKAGEKAFVGSGNPAAGEEELRRVKRELEVTRQERDILKKALAIFSRAQS